MEHGISREELHPVQKLLEFAEQIWGPQFDDEGKQRWWCDDKILMSKEICITNGTDHFACLENGGFMKLAVRPLDNEVIAASTSPIGSKEEAEAPYMQVIWD